MRRWLAILVVIGCLLTCFSLSAAAEEEEPPKLIALTFDDGPGPHTRRLLEELKARDAKVTFFILGCNAESYPETLQQAYQDGHQIANHTYSHNLLTDRSDQQIQQQIIQTEQILDQVCGEGTTYLFRPPFGEYSDRILKLTDAPVISWAVDPLDWKCQNAQKVADCIVQNAFDGAIVLSHDIYSTTVDGVVMAVDRLKQEGYEFVTVNELFRRRGVEMKSGKVYYRCRPTGILLPEIAQPVITTQTATGGVQIAMSTDDGAKIYYTTDGTMPTLQSAVYQAPFTVSKTCTIRAVAAYQFNGSRSDAAQAEIKIPPATASVSPADEQASK